MFSLLYQVGAASRNDLVIGSTNALLEGLGYLFDRMGEVCYIDGAKGVGVKEAAEMTEVHYTTVYVWRRRLDALGKEAFLDYKPPSVGRGIKRIREA